MMKESLLETERLLMRSFCLDDADTVRQLAGEFEIADTTIRIPHPYEQGMAEEWINSHSAVAGENREIVFAVTDKINGQIMGSISLMPELEFDRAELGYWIGKPFWGKGYATEAARAILKYGFNKLKLNRIHAHHFSRNPASGRILQKIGMKHEGHMRQHVKKWGKYEDIDFYGIMKNEFDM